jgi:hypothetical protein
MAALVFHNESLADSMVTNPVHKKESFITKHQAMDGG